MTAPLPAPDRRPTTVALIQRAFPHYREAVFRALAAHPGIELTLVHGSGPPRSAGEAAHAQVRAKMPFRVLAGPIKGVGLFGKALLWHAPAVELLRRERFDVVIHLLERKWVSLWTVRRLQRQRGGRFIVWGQGAPGRAPRAADAVRSLIVRSADAAVFYSERGRASHVAAGADPRRCFVARNTLDVGAIDAAAAAWPGPRLDRFRADRGLGAGPVLLYVGRLLRSKRPDLLLRAAELLRPAHPHLKVVLIGQGPCRDGLLDLRRRAGLDSAVLLPGGISDEQALAPWFLASDLVVVPGAAGLVAVHAHAYGRAVVTSDRWSIHGPEIEVVLPGRTGQFFRHGSAESLAEAAARLLADPRELAAAGRRARRRAREDFSLPSMVNGFLKAIGYATGREVPLLETPRDGAAPAPAAGEPDRSAA